MTLPSEKINQMIEAERRLLAALCQRSLPETARAKIQQTLAQHHFQLPEHEIILRAINELPVGTPEGIREALQTKVTCMGFPDTDIDVLFSIEPATEGDLAALFAELRNSQQSRRDDRT